MRFSVNRCSFRTVFLAAIGLAVFSSATEAQTISPCGGGPLREFNISAIDVTMPVNRWGDHVPNSHMYALDANIPSIRAFEAALAHDRSLPEIAGEPDAVTRVSHGLRKDPIQPLVLRANRGECLRLRFTHQLADGEPAALHIQGLPHTAENAGGAVGRNPDTFAAPGGTVTYEIPIPDRLELEGAYVFHGHGGNRARQENGLFGVLVVEPPGAVYLDPETGAELDSVTGSGWEAIIRDREGSSFREIVLIYHQIPVLTVRDRLGKHIPVFDRMGVFHPATSGLNYRTEPFFRRANADEDAHGETAVSHIRSLGRSSYAFGDPATPIPRAYLGENIRTHLVHGGTELFHVHHQHGGMRWRRSPGADAASMHHHSGLDKAPAPGGSIRVDTHLLGPGASYTLEHECGAGGCQQAAGDFLFRSLIGHHEHGGIWGFYRVFDTVQNAATNLYGRPLAVIPELYQADNPFTNSEAPSNQPPAPAVSAGELLGLVVDGGRTIVDDALLTNPKTEIGLADWVRRQLPPPGKRLDRFDATVWDWTFDTSAATPRVLGEPEAARAFANYVSKEPGARPEVLFNPRNGRYAWPPFRPHFGARPPFSARHGGAPWLGEKMAEDRLDGLCAANGAHPEVVVSHLAVDRFYPMSAVDTPIQVAPGPAGVDPDGRLYVLNEDVPELRAAAGEGDFSGEPLAVRSALGDCVEVLFTNQIPDGPLNGEFSLAGLHSSLTQLDPQASDGTVAGFSFEQTVRPIVSEGRLITAAVKAGATSLEVDHTERLRPGVWIGIGLGEGVCGATSSGQPRPCTEIRQISSVNATSITLDEPLALDHGVGEAVGVEFVRYLWYADTDLGTTILQPAVDFRNLDHGLFGAHVIEPTGSTWRHPATGEEVRSALLADIEVPSRVLSLPAAPASSFRELVLLLHNNSPVAHFSSFSGGTVNLRAEPWIQRQDSAYRFSSVRYGDPRTPILRSYVGDPVRIRAAGMLERYSGVRFPGQRFALEPDVDGSPLSDTIPLGNGERFDVALGGGAGGAAGQPGDYLYYSTVARDFEAGAWGLLRVHDRLEDDLRQLPNRGSTPPGEGFPRLTFTGKNPPMLPGLGSVCPASAPRRQYSLVAASSPVVYNDSLRADVWGEVYRLKAPPTASVFSPLAIRANAGDCLVLEVQNLRARRSGLHVGKLLFDPQRAYGSAVGFNYDSTLAPGQTRKYELFADRELGTALALDLGDLEATHSGAFGAVIIEPEGAQYFHPGRTEPLSQGGWGLQADVVTDSGVVREVVALFNDQDNRLGQNRRPYLRLPEDETGISYSREPLELRGLGEAPADVFKSERWGDPRHVVTVPAGQPLVYRLAKPWGYQAELPTLEGHRFSVAGGERYGVTLLPGQTHDLTFVGGAGSDIGAPGDYLFGDRRLPFLEAGLWQLLRVTDDGSSGAADTVTIRSYVVRAVAGLQILKVTGRSSLRPAGDFADEVTLHEGLMLDGRCQGPPIGRQEVDTGHDMWFVKASFEVLPEAICVQSSGGGSVDTPLLF